MQRIATTIVARNYLAQARGLSRAFLRHHPGGRFFVLLVDEPQRQFDATGEPFELVRLRDIDLPAGDLFLYQYSILELCTAVKPFLLRHLLARYAPESIIYLDPDVFLCAPLDAPYAALRDASVVLTPHMLSPPPDDGCRPAERDILLSGAYNLGFLGLRHDPTSARFLDWWGDRLASQCLVDIHNALFVDQRWVDLVPSYFPDVAILRDPSLNVAYWNLHERSLGYASGRFTVDGSPLGFFHLSGFDPMTPEILSRHQSRHTIVLRSSLARLVRQYSDRLMTDDHATCARLPIPFATLDNGVRLGRLTHWAVRRALARGVLPPSPTVDPDGFCRFLMTPNYSVDASGVAPLVVALGHIRPDVRAAYPASFESWTQADSLRDWMRISGEPEESLGALYSRFGHLLGRASTVHHALQCWQSREDLRRAFPRAFSDVEGSDAFGRWIEHHGEEEERFCPGDAEVFRERRKGVLRPLMLYLQDAALQREFRFLFLERDCRRFVHWLYAEACPRGLVTADDVAWFDGFARNSPDLLATLVLGHGGALLRGELGGATAFDLRPLRGLLAAEGVPTSGRFLLSLYRAPAGRDLVTQAEEYHGRVPELRSQFPSVFRDGRDAPAFVEVLLQAWREAERVHPGVTSFASAAVATGAPAGFFRRVHQSVSRSFSGRRGATAPRASREADHRSTNLAELRDILLDQMASPTPEPLGVNLAGYLHSVTGMGESARSMLRTLHASGVACRAVPLPETHPGPWLDLDHLGRGEVFRAHDPTHRVNVVVVNADALPHVRTWLPRAFWRDRTSVGYWVWETDRLPSRLADTEGLSEVWTPSEYSATAIRKTIDLPVRVVPHVLDFTEISQAIPNRHRFGIPPEVVAFGFFFDCKSVVERKNPLGVIEAFRRAFGSSTDRAVLVLKAASREAAPEAFTRLLRAASGMNVVWVTDTFTRPDTLSLMSSLDVYVSLHRAEGFGLTLAEAMAMRKPVLASAHSGNMDFMADSTAALVRTGIVETERDLGPYPRGTRWGDPDLDHAAQRLLEMLDEPLRQRIGEAAARAVRKQLGPGPVGAQVGAQIAELYGSLGPTTTEPVAAPRRLAAVV